MLSPPVGKGQVVSRCSISVSSQFRIVHVTRTHAHSRTLIYIGDNCLTLGWEDKEMWETAMLGPFGSFSCPTGKYQRVPLDSQEN